MRTKKRKSTRRSKRGKLIRGLSADEAKVVLDRCIAACPDLESKAEHIARSVLSEASFKDVANDVEGAIRLLDIDDLNETAGSHSWGYVEPTEAAYDLIQQEVDPYLDDMRRRIDLGLEAEALEICKGIVLGLYRLKEDKGNDVLGWAPDFREEIAGWTIDCWRRGSGDTKKARSRERRHLPAFPQDFIERWVPDWEPLIMRSLRDSTGKM